MPPSARHVIVIFVGFSSLPILKYTLGEYLWSYLIYFFNVVFVVQHGSRKNYKYF